MIQTALLYSGMLLLCWLIARNLDNKPKHAKTSLFAIIILLSILCGLRSFNVGSDTKGYYDSLDILESRHNFEIGFRVLCGILMKITSSKVFVFFMISLMTNTFFVVRLYTLKEIAPMKYSFPIFYVMIYFLTFSGIRQLLAVSICFFATYFLFEKKRLIIYVALTLLASTFHTSAVISFAFLLLELFSKSSDKKWNWLKFFIVILSPFLFYFAFNLLIENYGDFFEKYKREQSTIGLMVGFRFVLLFLTTIFYFSKQHDLKNASENIFKKLLVIEFVTILLNSFDYFFANISRIGWYFEAFTPIIYAYILRKKDIGIVPRGMVLICIGYTYLSMLLSQTSYLVPYEFFWNV